MSKSYYTLITGASEGLGKCFALECASRKMNLILVALPNSGLDKLSAYIRKTFFVDVIFYEDDISTEESCTQLFHFINNKHILVRILINNAGMGGTFSFQQKDIAYYAKLISLNTITPTVLSRLLLGHLKAAAPSHILNVSSLAAMFSLPHKQVYGGTKSFLLFFSKSLRRELKRDNVFVSALCPGGIDTTPQLIMMHRTTGTWLSKQSVLDPWTVARIAIDKMLKKKEVIIPGFLNRMFLLLNSIFPRAFKDFLISYQMNRTFSSAEKQVLKRA